MTNQLRLRPAGLVHPRPRSQVGTLRARRSDRPPLPIDPRRNTWYSKALTLTSPWTIPALLTPALELGTISLAFAQAPTRKAHSAELLVRGRVEEDTRPQSWRKNCFPPRKAHLGRAGMGLRVLGGKNDVC